MKTYKINQSKTVSEYDLLDELISTNNNDQAIDEYYDCLDEIENLEQYEALDFVVSGIRIYRIK